MSLSGTVSTAPFSSTEFTFKSNFKEKKLEKVSVSGLASLVAETVLSGGVWVSAVSQ